MSTQERFLAVLFAVALAQAAFLTPVVANLEGINRRATRLLALLLLCFLPMIGEELISTAGLARRFPHSLGSSVAFDLLIAPLLFFYARSLIHRDRRFVRWDLLHLLPFGLSLLVLLPFYVSSGAEKVALMERGLPLAFTLVIAAKIPVAAGYLGVVIRDLSRFTKRSGDPSARDPNVVWLLRSRSDWRRSPCCSWRWDCWRGWVCRFRSTPTRSARSSSGGRSTSFPFF